jgi:hypothetical protein
MISRLVSNHSPVQNRLAVSAGLAVLITCASSVQAQSIFVPNHSFELQTAPNSFPYVNTFVDSWEKIAEPAYYGPLTGGFPPWFGTAGVFLDVNPYSNVDGNQAGYILGFPQVTLFQDYDSSPTHDFNATFEVGKSYKLTVGVFGKNNLLPGSTLQLSLYYRDNLNNKTNVASTTLVYSLATFPTNTPLSLVDFEVNVPVVQAGDGWAGKHIGIQLESTIPVEMTSGGNWDFDNVRLTAVPEPASLSLGAVACVALLLRKCSRRQT